MHKIEHPLASSIDLWWIAPDTPGGASRKPAGPRLPAPTPHPGRVTLRRLLAERLPCAVDALRIEPDALGKPRIQGDLLRFNMSHAASEYLIAIGERWELGVDLEIAHPVPELRAMVDRHLTPVERGEWSRRPDASQNDYFLRCWTRKEACLKALGVGLALRPSAIETLAVPREGRARVFLHDRYVDVEVCTLTLPSGSIGALACAAPEDARRACSAVATIRRNPHSRPDESKRTEDA